MAVTLEQRLRQTWRALKATWEEAPPGIPTGACTAIGELREGDVATVVGRVRCFDEPQLLAPLCRERCAYYRTRLIDKSEGTIIDEAGMQSFDLVDETGEVLVRVENPTVHLAMDAHVAVGVLQPFDEATRAFLAKHERDDQRWWYERDIRFEEGLIEHGEVVAVAGAARHARGGAATMGSYRDRSRRMVIEGTESFVLQISDILGE